MSGAARTPLIGVTTWCEPARFGTWDVEAQFMEWAFVEAIEASGGRVLALPPLEQPDAAILRRLDGLVINGGGDVEPGVYGQPPQPETAGVVPARDRSEIALARAAVEADQPLLGVCRGQQVMTVAWGGTLDQHIEPDSLALHSTPEAKLAEHTVRVAPGSRLAPLLGDALTVPSHHHQRVRTLGAGWVPAAWAPDDTIEAMEREDVAFAVGVQWHPEWSEDRRLFAALTAHARERIAAVPTSVPTPSSGDRRPVIGIAAFRADVAWNGWTAPMAVLPTTFARAIERAGGLPLIVPPSTVAVRATAAVLDGLVFVDGGEPCAEREVGERALRDVAIAAGSAVARVAWPAAEGDDVRLVALVERARAAMSGGVR